MLKRIIVSPFFIFPVVACLVFWPFTLQLFTVKNDALTYYYPIRTLISDALRNGELPLWTPFINMGYPLHADMQSGAWNPVIWIFAFLSNYSLAAFHYELLLYISCAGIGFFLLCRDLGCSKMVAITMGFAFQFSGFMIDSVQFFNCISSTCYLPFVFLFFRRILVSSKRKDAASLALFMFLLFTGGYPSLFIILCYILAAYGLYTGVTQKHTLLFLKRQIPTIIFFALVFLLLSLPAIVSFVQHLPTIERGGKQPLSIVLQNSMNPSTTLSVLLPFATTSGDSWLESSILMRSVYMGVIPLAFLVAAFFNKRIIRNRQIQFFLLAAAILLGLAWGENFFLRTLAYHTLPLMDSFRHPALFRLFTIFFLLLAAALCMQHWFENKQAYQVILKKIVYGFLLFLLAITTWALVNVEGSAFVQLFKVPGPSTLAQLPFSNRLLMQLPFVLLILMLTLLALNKRWGIAALALIVFADLFIAAQLNMPITVIGAKSFSQVERTLNRNPVKYPLPGNNSIETNSANSLDELHLSGSKLPFTKKIGRNGYFITPGNLINQEAFYNSSIQASVFKNPVFYFADSLVSLEKSVSAGAGKIAFIQDRSLPEKYLGINQDIIVTDLSANSIVAKITNPGNGLLVLQQNNYAGWTAYIDEKPATIVPVNITFMAVRTPAGTHDVRFEYKPGLIKVSFYISMLTLALTLVYVIILFSKSQKARPPQEN